MTVDQHMRRA